ncbi:long-chain fatty acid--CoA ligase [Streptomyces piniterrae]|uniref:Long-chain fatty acid--CoA ligase n=1 Tax=Streptomyces piniterrae TaxID=2571125 RepID=A0A4U0NWR7_9ACTN|nr:AMP-binding protein [Streptomyces piniterrae]TJZ59225.1 long-chain fatty acid--CoA ligase [Streptomyces piniterrae]
MNDGSNLPGTDGGNLPAIHGSSLPALDGSNLPDTDVMAAGPHRATSATTGSPDGRRDDGTLAHLARRNAECWPAATAVRWRDADGVWCRRTYAEAWRASEETARGLMALGLGPGDRVAVLSTLRPEWTFALMGAAASGLVVVSLLPTTVPEEIEHVLNDCGARAVLCENTAQLAKVEAAWPRLPHLRRAVLIDAPDVASAPLGNEDRERSARTMTLAGLRALGAREVAAEELRRRSDSVRAEDLLLIIYTSGTTGPKKGCALTHGNYVSVLRAHPQPPPKPDAAADHNNGTIFVVTGPHTIAMLMQVLAWWSRYTLAYRRGGGTDRLADEVREARPQILPLVPLALEQIYSAVLASWPQEDTSAVIEAARTGLEVRERRSRGERIPPRLQSWFDETDRTLFAQVREHFGGAVRRVTVSGAAVSQDILAFFLGCGVPVVECYGMTETAAAATSNSPDDYRLGTVGKPLPGIDVALAPDGEVLIRGANVFPGYWGYHEDEFGAVRDGWLYTGDLGAFDADGYLTLTGRKKELIQLSHGVAVTPHPLERELRTSPLVSNAVTYGEGKPHLVVLLTLDERQARTWAAERGLPTDLPRLVGEPELLRELNQVLADANARLQEYYRAQAFTLLERDLSMDEGELTISMKVARPVVHKRFRDRFEALYE